MNSQDFYEKAGFKCGLEIHIQLNTEKKLFCGCPNRRSAEFPLRIERKIRPSAGELGKMDSAALHEFLRGRSFSYVIDSKTACLVEMDEEPPHEINREALETSLSVAKALGCAVPDEIIVMRKAVADGSAVSGFQRTALVGLNGKMETEYGRVRIANLSLEEDSATPIGKENGIEYRLDRLGVPLIEIGTEPDIKNPEQAKRTAEKIGMLLFENRMRGIGAIRQDLNVSIKGGARVEIKGVQELEKIEMIIESEIKRQQSLIEIKNELAKRNASAGGGAAADCMKDVTGLFENTRSSLIQKTLGEGGSVFAGLLKGFAGMMKKDCGGRSFGKELSSYAGAFGLGIIHSDETEKFPFLAEDFAALRKELSAGANDLIFIVAGKDAERASSAVMRRAAQAMKGVPEETRAANPDGTTSYLRPLPGAGRMYPETDVPAIFVSREFLKKIRLPKSAEEKIKELKNRFEKMGIQSKQKAEEIVKGEYLDLIEKYIAEEILNIKLSFKESFDIEKNEIKKIKLNRLIKAVTEILPNLKREGVPVENLSEEKIYDIAIMRALAGEIIPDVLREAAENPDMDISQLAAVKAARSSGMTVPEAEKIVKEIVEKNRDALGKPSAFSIIMGEVMKRLRGRIDGSVLAGIVKREIENRAKK
ncbi:MAG: Glu-tRNA(Gln) amidotransferase subunit GatE [Nanoarchaeota archaeon]|nr:Glu-tRNA(Gln) amidotransferase subunit GatE [Nanoarchaeota archaeon]